MLNIETLGRSANAVIVAIAAAQFDPHGNGTIHEFQMNVDAESCQRAGLTLDASTVMWWLQQSDAARKAITRKDASDLHLVLDAFEDFVREIEAHEGKAIVWANSPAFDVAILNSAYKACGRDTLFEFRNERDWRTLTQLYPDIVRAHTREGVAHEAISDVRNQVAILQKVYQQIFPKRITGKLVGCAVRERDECPQYDYTACDAGTCECARSVVSEKLQESF